MILDRRGAKIYFSGKWFLDLLHKVWCHVWNDHEVRTPCHPCRNVIEFVSWWEPFCSYFCSVELKLLFGWLNWKLISISVRRVSHQHGLCLWTPWNAETRWGLWCRLSVRRFLRLLAFLLEPQRLVSQAGDWEEMKRSNCLYWCDCVDMV